MINSITSHLLNLLETNESYNLATHHEFLSSAGRGTLLPSTLSTWLAQDRIYALTYCRFISTLLSHAPIPLTTNRQETLEWRVISCLIDCLVNIKREVGMFEDIAANEGWEPKGKFFDDVKADDVTRKYEALFASCCWSGGVGLNGGGGPLGLWRGMVLLWATEQCYFTAWTYAKSEMEASGIKADSEEVKADVVRRELIPNWSSEEFAQFVKVLEDLVNEMGSQATESDIREAEDIWRQVLWVEQRFWPALS